MKKNVASQIIGCQLISKTDGSAVTSGTTTVYVTGDGGTQAAGSVGSGACTHEGNGFWTYAPAQAETNFDHIGFTFVNTSACNVSIQVYPTFPQTGDSFARLGAPAGASVSADVAAMKVDTAAILVDTGTTLDARIPAALVSGRMDCSVGAMAANVITAAATSADFTTEVTTGLSTLDAADVRTAVGLASANLDTQISTLATDALLTTVAGYLDTEIAAIKAKTDNLPASPAAVGSAMTLNSSGADAVWDEVVDGAYTARELMRLDAAALAGKASGLATTTAVYRDISDTKDRITATVDADGNRSAVTLDVT